MDIKQKLEECGVDVSGLDAADLDLENLDEIVGGSGEAANWGTCDICGEAASIRTNNGKGAICFSCLLDQMSKVGKVN